MRKNNALLFVAIAMLSTTGARAASWGDRTRYDRDADPFPDHQFSIDLFGTYADRDRIGNAGADLGGGVGVDYFFNDHIGLAADTYIEEWKLPYRVNGDLILRLPLKGKGNGLALYALGGGGRQFKQVPQYSGNAGGGLEYKFNPYTGLFSDYRRMFTDKTHDYNLVRAGLSIGF